MQKRTAIVTGASRGIGYEIAKQLGQDGYNIVAVATGSYEHHKDRLDWFSRNGIPLHYVQAHIENRNDRERIVSETVSVFGAVHALINNAGVAPLERTDLLEMGEESYDRVQNINTKAVMFLTQAVAKQMIAQPFEQAAYREKTQTAKKGVIVNISSCSAEVSSVTRGEYCVSKAGMSMLTKLYADRLAKERILVHEVRPGVIATDMTAAVQEKYDTLIARNTFPIPRWGMPEEVAAVVSAFCSDKFTYTTGDYVNVDGGFHILRL
ncbi:3-ketoacyl-ACP reductase [Treponema brennaborense]|uniref:3-oxoacyl-(Acyl-carrier-protein) reductase n=1 Tax=Treponema brennaborense (strain DSM 12168 / CIP 105900 / DD5/3) TaxID=906968 RepID=F4LPC3_TREBD|nr:3-ketoacyl-ACP reductase [Treponema brennaborense]AEE16985.1 3-oxoacyl-(acyl-carrier-protein) reductase [Treponema brennaborense DSM 12168]